MTKKILLVPDEFSQREVSSPFKSQAGNHVLVKLLESDKHTMTCMCLFKVTDCKPWI
jgi:hypothetical protein